MRSGTRTFVAALALVHATGCCCGVHPTRPRAEREARRESPAPVPSAAPSAVTPPPPPSPPTAPAPPSPAEQTLAAYADDLAVVADRLDAQIAEHERVYARFDPVRRVPSPADGTALAARPAVLEVSATPMTLGLIVRGLHSGHASDGQQGSIATIDHGADRLLALCPSLLSDDLDAIDVRYQRGDRATVTAAVRAPGVCGPRHQRDRVGDAGAVRRRIEDDEAVLFGYLERVLDVCTSGPRPDLGPLASRPGFVSAHASCTPAGAAAARSWGNPVSPVGEGAELRGTFRPTPSRLVRWSVDDAQRLELLVLIETREDGAEAYAEVCFRTD